MASSTPTLARLGLMFAAFFLFATAGVRAADQPATQPAFTIALPPQVSVQQAHDIVAKASVNRGWKTTENTPDRVVTYLNHRKQEATVTYSFGDGKVSAVCEGYAVDGKGVRQHPEQPTRWLKYLQEDITAALTKASLANAK